MLDHEFDESGVLTSAYASLFDVHPFTNVERDTLVDLANMTLEHKGTYYVTVMASDESLQCDVVTAPFTVDITPPRKGRIQIGPFANLALTLAAVGRSDPRSGRYLGRYGIPRVPVQYTDRGDEMTVLWEDFLDEESGILQYEITLLGPVQCGNTAHNAPQLTEPVTLSANYSSYTFVDLFLEGTMVYFVQLNAVNRATGSTTVTSSPVLIDPRDPIPGDIVDGDSFKRDVSHQSSTSSLHGTFTLYHGQEAYQCSYNHHDLDAPTEAWSPVTSQGVWGTSIEASRIRFAPEQLSYSVSNGLTVTMVRDVRAERMISGGYMTVLNHEGPGIFQVLRQVFASRPLFLLPPGGTQIDIVAAGSELDSVTSLVFWDGPAGVVGGFEMPSDPEESSNFSTSAPTTTPATTQNPWQIVNDNSEETSDENAVLQETAEGPTKYYILLWSRFQDEPSALQYEKIELGFDASEAWHTYGLKYTVDRTDATQELWGFELHIDGEYFTTITGIPPVSMSTKLILAVRSKQGAVAEFHDVFNPPTVMAHFKNLRTPPSAEMVCRYGTPFQDGSTTILKIFAGVGTTKGADDVEPFFEVEDLCTPCMDECSRYSCDMNCTVDDITLHHVFINNLHLSTHKMITQDNVTTSTPALYYITIKAVSDGVYIDATPPVFESLYHVDLSWSEDEPSDFQGSNSTIAVRWEAYDIESQVVGYFWAIGTAPFWTDIQDYVSVGLATSASNSQLEGSLQPLQTYYATVIAVNGAGLNTTKSTTGVTFLEESPSSENMTIGVGCREDQNDGSSSEDDVSVCPGIKSSVEISWPDFDEREGITGYYFSIGSTEELEDIIPETQVGYNESGTVLIEDGQVLINGQVIANISDLRHMQNDDQSTPEHVQLTTCATYDADNRSRPGVACRPHFYNRATDVRRRHSFPTFSEKT
ncbi:carbohydrate binding [Branchiostoma belcheri]|nr:carbohydrate binding [Branchiostoma belcheri]